MHTEIPLWKQSMRNWGRGIAWVVFLLSFVDSFVRNGISPVSFGTGLATGLILVLVTMLLLSATIYSVGLFKQSTSVSHTDQTELVGATRTNVWFNKMPKPTMKLMKRAFFGILWFVAIWIFLALIVGALVGVTADQSGGDAFAVGREAGQSFGRKYGYLLVIIAAAISLIGTIRGLLPGTKKKPKKESSP